MNLYVELLSIYRIKEWQADNCIQCDGDSAPVHWWQEYNGCGKNHGGIYGAAQRGEID